MNFFHGTSIGGLTELTPFASAYSNLADACVYLTTSKQLALHYIWDTDKYPIKTPMLDIRQNGVLVFQEMFSGALSYFYQGLSGYIYRCEGDYKINEDTGVISCATSNQPVPVTTAPITQTIGFIRRNIRSIGGKPKCFIKTVYCDTIN